MVNGGRNCFRRRDWAPVAVLHGPFQVPESNIGFGLEGVILLDIPLSVRLKSVELFRRHFEYLMGDSV
jgi:hypothetical protein